MTYWPLTNFFLISGLVFLIIAVIGQAKLGFAEINPGGCGRLLAFIIGVSSLIVALFLSIFPVETLEAIVTSLAQQIQQNLPNLTQFKLPS
ncbi:hypothetical protein ACE1CD_02950 [Aerosakkonema sp. BLCC-F183]|uniref:hypothetical protein n=1 Tax=Aerosakkonema sp. BLCC-F183 TaxID=3342834 RepID=UPI0035BB92BD